MDFKTNLELQNEYLLIVKIKIPSQFYLLDKRKETQYFQEEIKILHKYLDGIQYSNQKDFQKLLLKCKNNKKTKYLIDIKQLINLEITY